MCVYIYTYIHAYAFMYTHTHEGCVCVCVHKYMHMHICTHTNAHTHMHTQTHIDENSADSRRSACGIMLPLAVRGMSPRKDLRIQRASMGGHRCHGKHVFLMCSQKYPLQRSPHLAWRMGGHRCHSNGLGFGVWGLGYRCHGKGHQR